MPVALEFDGAGRGPPVGPAEGPGILATMEVGEVLRIDDRVTGFGVRNKEGRPCMVVRVEEPPRGGAWVVPRSTTGTTGTPVPAGSLPGLNREGRFLYIPRWVSDEDLAGCESLGVLADQLRDRVLEDTNFIAVDDDIEVDL